ncbi:MAG: cysteine--tRNA ligase [Bifidobacteriaceae bacterium]|jgi:cysteinyl-tRNA synthetase|nr:cysteine--tRNA ligase [Bifidobacteriaceae bacterium]
MQIIYNSALGKKKELNPIKYKQISIYLCGPTVQSAPHIGHIRSAIAFDIIVRWLKFSGNKVTYIRNITDINDKIFQVAKEKDLSWWEVSGKYSNAFYNAYKTLGCLDPSYEPLASAHINQMIDLIDKILQAGKAYIAKDGIYFDTSAYKDYGSLTNQTNDKNLADEEDLSKYKKNPRDFALWKFSKENNQNIFPTYKTPWGIGRPGWHLECSAMAKTYLGKSFDIHGGGLDLRFPHHENEQAQSKSVGWRFAKNWIHTAWVTQKGEKMSKSLGNGLLVKDILQKTSPLILRFALGSPHYRSQIEWDNETLDRAKNSLQSILDFINNLDEKLINSNNTFLNKVSNDFANSMNDDFNVPLALSVIYKQIKEYNASKNKLNEKNLCLTILTELNILGFNPCNFINNISQQNANMEKIKNALNILISENLDKRAEAKKNKEFTKADEIRQKLLSAGILIEDKSGGKQVWKI